MKAVVDKRKNKILPWGVEIELMDGRCIYMSAENVNLLSDKIDVIINGSNTISVPKASVRKILVMGSGNEDV